MSVEGGKFSVCNLVLTQIYGEKIWKHHPTSLSQIYNYKYGRLNNFFLDIHSSFAKILGETNFQPREKWVKSRRRRRKKKEEEKSR